MVDKKKQNDTLEAGSWHSRQGPAVLSMGCCSSYGAGAGADGAGAAATSGAARACTRSPGRAVRAELVMYLAKYRRYLLKSNHVPRETQTRVDKFPNRDMATLRRVM